LRYFIQKNKHPMKFLRYWLLSSFLLLASLAFCQQEGGTKTFIFIRHAEKMQEPAADPPLTEQGQQRARIIAALLKEQPVQAIFATPYRRTQETARPLAADKGLQVQTYAPAQGTELLQELKGRAGNETIVVVGHSNTTPDLINSLLGGEEIGPISEADYENLFIVTIPPLGQGSVVRMRLALP
jgi:2,3-bisphosphoglycerate-dependent phosphoglycerate mutase